MHLMRCSGTVSLAAWIFCEFGAGMYCACVGHAEGHVDSTYIVTNLLLEEQKSL